MTPEELHHKKLEVCLKEEEWREVHDFIASTKPYRKSLDSTLAGIQGGIWAVTLAVLVPFIMGFIWIGEIKSEVKQNTRDIQELKLDMKDHIRKG